MLPQPGSVWTSAVLTTERLVLRPFVQQDLDALAALHADERVMRYLTGAPVSRQVVEREVTRIGDSLQATDNPKWIVKDEVMVANKVTGLDGSGALLDYSATKGAIHAFTKSLAQMLVGKGIRVNCVAPGPVWTPLNPADRPADKVAEFGIDSDMRRPAQPEEMSPAYVFLASDVCSGYVTGIVLPVTGSVDAI